MAKKKSCFIIMPITTPSEMVERYNNDPDHFKHVMEVLFVPAVDAAGLRPISPISSGAELIHGDIIKKIETTDMLLCDMSSLNANVFFELGMRTATNKPVALVKDTATDTIPFDLRIINHHTYSHKLRTWEMADEIESLKKHIEACLEKAEEGNALWQHLSVTVKAEPIEGEPDTESQLGLINRQLDDLRNRLDHIRPEARTYEPPSSFRKRVGERTLQFASAVEEMLDSAKIHGRVHVSDAGHLMVRLISDKDTPMSRLESLRSKIVREAAASDLDVIFQLDVGE